MKTKLMLHIIVTITIFLSLIGTPSFSKEFIVRNAKEIATALRQVSPGDEVVLSDGTWKDQYIQFNGHGKEKLPIILRPENKGKVLLTGSSRLDISGSWLVVEGLRFENGSLEQDQHIVRFNGSMGEANNCRFSNSTIMNYNPKNLETRYFWVSLYGKQNKIDFCRFEGHNHAGVTVAVIRRNDEPNKHLIEYNHFINRQRRAHNGDETVRIGTGVHSKSNSDTVVQYNLFELTNGDLEVISLKASNNTIRFNTFRQVSATVTLRQGNYNKIISNFFLGDNVAGTGGIRITGEDHLIANNIFQELSGAEGGAIVLICGHRTEMKSGYAAAQRIVIAHNTIVNIKNALLKLDNRCEREQQSLLPENLIIANNLMVNSEGQLIDGEEGAGWIWEGNIAYSKINETRDKKGMRIIDPRLEKSKDGIWRPDSKSPVIDAASRNKYVSDDIDGQPRDNFFDIGADEISSSPILNIPLSAKQVGPR